MVERRSTVEAEGTTEGRGTTEVSSQQQQPVPMDYTLVVRQDQWVFSSGVIIVMAFVTVVKFVTYSNYFYTIESFVPFCLLLEQKVMIRHHIDTFNNVMVVGALVPAILADNYIGKEWLIKIMLAIGSLSSVALCLVATVCAHFSYSQSFALKENLFVSFIALQSMNELARPLLIALLFDQIVHMRDFTIDTSNIFAALYLCREFCLLLTFCIAIYTITSKTAAARVQILPPILSMGAVFIFIFLTWWKYPLISHPIQVNGIWKIVGCLNQRLTGFLMKTLFRLKAYRPLIAYSKTTHKESKVFWSIALVLICVIPYYYCLDVIAMNSLTKRSLAEGRPRDAIHKVYAQIIKWCFLFFSQFFIFPLLYRTKLRRVLFSPMRRMVTSYGIVGLCGLATFVIVCLHQRQSAELFLARSSKTVSIYNILNENRTVYLSFNKRGGGVPIDMEPYERHLIILEKSAPLQMSILNEYLGIDDYYELMVNHNDAFVLTPFGLEKIDMNEFGAEGNVYGSRIFVFCLMIVCRGSVVVECNGRTNMFELHSFGLKHKMDVKKHSKCKMKHNTNYGVGGTENAELEIIASQPVYYLAAVEDMTGEVSIKLLSYETAPAINLWAMLPLDLVSSWANMVFEIASCQFILIESPISCRTIIAAVMFTYQNLGHMCSSRWVVEDGLVSERNGFIFSAVYFVGFVWFLTRMSRFNTAEQIKQLYVRAEEEEMKYYQTRTDKNRKPKASFASGDSTRSSFVQN